MNEKSNSINLDEHFTGEHFHENVECGTVGEIVKNLVQLHGGVEEGENIHEKLLLVLQKTSAKDLLKAVESGPRGAEDMKDALAHLLHIEECEKDCYYYSYAVGNYSPPLEQEVIIGLPTQRVLVKGQESVHNCCDLIEQLLIDAALGLEKSIIYGRGEPNPEPRGLLLQLKDENTEGEGIEDAIRRFRKANDEKDDALVLSKEGWTKLAKKIDSIKCEAKFEEKQIICDGLKSMKVHISSQMPENVGAIINTEDVFLAARITESMNSWWNYKETLDLQIYWKYRYACNLVVKGKKSTMKIDIDKLKASGLARRGKEIEII